MAHKESKRSQDLERLLAWMACEFRLGATGQEPLEGGRASWTGRPCLATFCWPFTDSPSGAVPPPAGPEAVAQKEREPSRYPGPHALSL